MELIINKRYNKAVEFARIKHGLDAAQKTRRTTYLSRYASKKWHYEY